MNRLAHRDLLTGLSNRKEVAARISQAMELTAATRSHGALLLLNLDNFGIFNNVKGYEVRMRSNGGGLGPLTDLFGSCHRSGGHAQHDKISSVAIFR